MPKTIYLCTCKDAYEKEKIAFADLKEAEDFLADCIDYAFDMEEKDVDNDGWNKQECINNWHMECGDYYAQIEQIELF